MNKKGFTLVEVILSLAIVGIIAVAILPIFNIGLKNILISGNRTEAVARARDNIYDDAVLSEFTIEVKLPSVLQAGVTENVEVQGNVISSSAEIQGSGSRTVDLYMYVPNNY